MACLVTHKVNYVEDHQEHASMEGYLTLKFHVKRSRYCVLRDRTIHVFNKKEDYQASEIVGNAMDPHAFENNSHQDYALEKKKIEIVGVKDAIDIEANIRSLLLSKLGYTGLEVLESLLLVVTTVKSKLVVLEAETESDKRRWLHALTILNLPSASSERQFCEVMLSTSSPFGFDAHIAVTLLHTYRAHPIALDLIIDRLTIYAEQGINDLEFYIPQIIHLIVNVELATPAKLVDLLLQICKATAYVEHLGNSIHLALQMFWLLEAKLQESLDNPRRYNLCAKLLLSIEAKVVNQHFEVPRTLQSKFTGEEIITEIECQEGVSHSHVCGRYAKDEKNSVSRLLMALPGMEARLQAWKNSQSSDIIKSEMEHSEPPATILLQWMEHERVKRYRYFHEQYDFVKSLTDISEAMIPVPPQDRKLLLPKVLSKLSIPKKAYVPLGKTTDPFLRVTRVLINEGTVFSTATRAPCLICLEVIADNSNIDGLRQDISSSIPKFNGKNRGYPSTFHRTQEASPRNSYASSPLRLSTLELESEVSSSQTNFSCIDEEYLLDQALLKFLIQKGKTILWEPAVEGRSISNKSNIQTLRKIHLWRSSSSGEDYFRANSEGGKRSDNEEDAAVLSSDHKNQSGNHDKLNFAEFPSTHSNATLFEVDQSSRKSIDVQQQNSLDTCNLRNESISAYEDGLSQSFFHDSSIFGESWQNRKERIRTESPNGHLPGWDIISLISKSNDDLQQEVFAMQLIQMFQWIFKAHDLPIYLRPYRIIATGKTVGLIETITDATSLDSLKKQPSHQSLLHHFKSMYTTTETFQKAQKEFLYSLVAYSLVTYLLQIKDRHNGNILIDTSGHIIHIDFGFMLGIAPGGVWSLEKNVPFKLTKEMVEVLGGIESPLFREFCQLFLAGLRATQIEEEKIITLVDIMMRNSTFPCFEGNEKNVSRELIKLRSRLLLNKTAKELTKEVIKIISSSYKSKWTSRYDQYQKLTNGIML